MAGFESSRIQKLKREEERTEAECIGCTRMSQHLKENEEEENRQWAQKGEARGEARCSGTIGDGGTAGCKAEGSILAQMKIDLPLSVCSAARVMSQSRVRICMTQGPPCTMPIF